MTDLVHIIIECNCNNVLTVMGCTIMECRGIFHRYLTPERIKEITDKARQQAIEDINWMTQEERINITKIMLTKN